MYVIMSVTFIKIDSLQHIEISRQAYPTYQNLPVKNLLYNVHCFDVMLIFPE